MADRCPPADKPPPVNALMALTFPGTQSSAVSSAQMSRAWAPPSPGVPAPMSYDAPPGFARAPEVSSGRPCVE